MATLAVLVPGSATGPGAASLAAMAATTVAAGHGVCIINECGSNLPWLRSCLAKQAIDAGAEMCLWVDADMTYPPDLALRMLSRGLDVVAANGCVKRFNSCGSAMNNETGMISSEGRAGLEEVDATGFGVLLMKTEIFSKLRFPWFDFVWRFRGNGANRDLVGSPEDWSDWQVMGEDYFFSARLREAGFRIYIDHSISQEVGHYGGTTFYPGAAEASGSLLVKNGDGGWWPIEDWQRLDAGKARAAG